MSATGAAAGAPGRSGPDAEGRIWLITGAGRGLGREFAERALADGDRVIATARTSQALVDLAAAHPDAVLPIALDVADRPGVFAAVDAAVAHFGRIDVLVNNAGYGLTGAVEELDEARLRAQLEVNFFGAVWCAQAVLPHMRARGAGHILQISSVGGVVALPGLGGYAASKWALEAISESLAQEVADFGIRVTIVEPGPFRSDWNGTSMDRAEWMDAYDGVLGHVRRMYSGEHAFTQPGDPSRAAQALRTLVSTDQPPLRLLLGQKAVELANEAYARRLAEWAQWEAVARRADFDPAEADDARGER